GTPAVHGRTRGDRRYPRRRAGGPALLGRPAAGRRPRQGGGVGARRPPDRRARREGVSVDAEPGPRQTRRGGILLPFRLLGVPVRLDVTFLLALPLFAYVIGSQLPEFTAQLRQVALLRDPDLARRLVPGQSESVAWLVGLVAALGLFASVLVHELGHAVVARLYGVRTLEIRLWFLGGVAQFKDLPRRRGAEAIVALAGPATSLALGALLWLALPSVPLGSTATTVVAYLGITNVGLALFNLLPAIPLDGGRVLRSLLALAMPRLRATNVAVAISAALAALMGFYGVVSEIGRAHV